MAAEAEAAKAMAAAAAAAESAAAISADEADDDEKETSTTTAQQAALTAQVLVLQRAVAALMEEKTARAGEEAHNVHLQAESAIQQSGISLESIREAEEQTRATEGGVHLARGAALGDETATSIDEQLRQAQAQMQQVQAKTAALQRQQAAIRSAMDRSAAPSTPLAVPIAHRSNLRSNSTVATAAGGMGSGGSGGDGSSGYHTSLAQMQQASAASLARVNPLRQHAKRLQPSELLGREAAKGSVLEDWIFQIERSIGDEQHFSPADIIGFARAYWDRSVNTWWNGYSETLVAKGTPVRSWEEVKSAMRANYTAASDEQTACDQLYNLSMRDTETMDEYVARVSETYNRIPRARVSAEAAAEHMQRGVKPVRFPLTMVEVTTRQQRERATNAGKGLGFEVMRGMLIEAAVREPTHLIAAAAAAAAAATPYQQNNRPGQTNNRSKRINNVSTARGRYPPPDEEEDDRQYEGDGNQDERQLAHSVNTGEMKCYRCGQVGHLSRDCKKAETRTCHTCKKAGHLASRCPSKNGGGTGGSKNE